MLSVTRDVSSPWVWHCTVCKDCNHSTFMLTFCVGYVFYGHLVLNAGGWDHRCSPTFRSIPADVYDCVPRKVWPGVPHPVVPEIGRLGRKMGFCMHEREKRRERKSVSGKHIA